MGTPLTTTVPFAGDSLDTLKTSIRGAFLVPGGAGYDEARMGWNLSVEQRPAAIVVASSAADIAEAVRFARQEGLGIAVQATGHGIIRPADDCLLIVTSQMKDVRVNAGSQTAWVAAGAKWGLVLEKAQAAGLAPLLGSSPDVGAIGYTLGGGLGWLARKYGLAADSVRSFELVTADGRTLRASDSENSDLFWGLRGGGGAFGVITGMEIQLYPVTTIFGGNLVYPVELAGEVLARYRAWIASAPEELTSSVVLANFPPLPMIPELLRGKSVVMVRGCYCGPAEQGEALFQSWLDWKAPVANMLRVMPFSDVAEISSDPEDPVPAFSSGAWLRELNDEAIDTLIQYGVSVNGSSPILISEIRHVGGVMGRVDRGSNAFGNRDASLLLQLIAMAPTPEAKSLVQGYAAQYKRALEPHLTGGVYMNFLEGEESRQRIEDAYLPETYRRLRALKARYDPDNLFNYGFNIPPGE